MNFLKKLFGKTTNNEKEKTLPEREEANIAKLILYSKMTRESKKFHKELKGRD
ncbi:MAG: hypothetical protein J7L14_00345 [Candidatus Diapherotrites archaeon]|nr:hypothetical protein [Candidatus Diapherotrites archaeon]